MQLAGKESQRNMDKNKPVAGSQLKTNEAAKTIVCALCKQNFLGTMRKPALSEHAENRHSKKFEDCFPSYVEPAK